jgi:hypothetical protein
MHLGSPPQGPLRHLIGDRYAHLLGGTISTPTALPSSVLPSGIGTPIVQHPAIPQVEGSALPNSDSAGSQGFSSITDYELILAISGDEPLIRRLNRLPGAVVETCTTSGKGSDAHWRLNPADVVSLLEEIVNAPTEEDNLEGLHPLGVPTHLELEPDYDEP